VRVRKYLGDRNIVYFIFRLKGFSVPESPILVFNSLNEFHLFLDYKNIRHYFEDDEKYIALTEDRTVLLCYKKRRKSVKGVSNVQ